MARDKNFVTTPAEDIGSCPEGYKGSGSHEYDGEDVAPFGSYRRTSTPNGPPEVMEDGNVGPMSGGMSKIEVGKDGEYK